jgi:hypothetical protein
LAVVDDFRALSDQGEGRDGPHHAQTRQRRRRADQRRLELRTTRVVIHDIRFESETPPIRGHGLHLRRGLTDHQSRGFVILAPPPGPRARALPGRGHVDTGPEACLPWRQRQARPWAAALPLAIHPHPPLEAKAPGPTHPRPRFHAMRVGEPTIRRTDARTPHGKPCSALSPPICVEGLGHTAAGLFAAWPPQRHGSATRDERQAHHTVGRPHGGGIQSQGADPVSPRGSGGRQPGAIACRPGDPGSVEPASTPPHATLRVYGAAVPIERPRRETDGSRRQEAHEQPGQGLGRPKIPPGVSLAEDVHQRMRERRRAPQVDPPGKPVVPQSV